ncbi:MAG: PAS domain S-box protein [Thermoanaerobaculia bacterium]|nr:PAS domain S-box protein [Thermoanaerobaculia bacterium]
MPVLLAKRSATWLSRIPWRFFGLLSSALGFLLLATGTSVLLWAPSTLVEGRFADGLRLGWTRLALEQIRFLVHEQQEHGAQASDHRIEWLVDEIEGRFAGVVSLGDQPLAVPIRTARFLGDARRFAGLDPGAEGRRSAALRIANEAPAVLAEVDLLLRQMNAVLESRQQAELALRSRVQTALELGGLLLVASLLASAVHRLVNRTEHSETRLQVIFDRHPLPILIHRIDDDRIVDANPAASLQYGYELEELRRLRVTDLTPKPDDSTSTGPEAPPKSELFGPWSQRRRDGTSFLADVSTAAFGEPEGGLMLSVVQDVTARERSIHRLSVEEARFRSLAESLAEAVLVTDTEGRVSYANPRFEEITGRSAQAAVGSRLRGELADSLESITRHLVERSRGGSRVYLHDFERPDGETVWLEVNNSPLYGANGRVQGIVAAFTDVTARQRAEQALRDRERRLSTLLQQVPAVVWTTDRNLEFTSLQGGLGTDDSLPVSALTDLVGDGPENEVIPAHQRALQGSVESFEMDYDGRIYRGRVEPYYEDDELAGVICVSLDITEERQAELERRHLDRQLRDSKKMEAVGRLAGGIAHDFNNLLTIIHGNAEILVQTLDEEEPPELTEIRQAAHSAATLTRQLLAFSRRQHIQPTVFEIDSAIRETCRLLNRVIGEDIELVHVEGSDRARIQADTSQVHQMLLNLAINARDAMPDGGCLEIRTDRHRVDRPIPVDRSYASSASDTGELLPPGEFVRLQVRDDGIGMDAETLEHAFEPFFTTKEPDVGTGLGLASVHGIVRQAGGCIDAESIPGHGTTITILLPVTEQAASSVSTKPVPTAERLRGSARVLLVEDESAVRQMLARGLRRRGYDVVEAGNGEDALLASASCDGSVDLVVTDVLMPDMKGPELVKRMNELGLESRVLFISGYPNDALQRQRTNVEYLQKPFDLQTLARRIEKLLDQPPKSAEISLESAV